LAEVFAKRDLGLALLTILLGIEFCLRIGFYLLADLLAPVGAQLGCAGAHDGVGRRDVGLLGSGEQLQLVNCPPCIPRKNRTGWYSLALLKLGLQDLAMMLHALDVALCISLDARGRGVDIPVSQNVGNVGRHIELIRRWNFIFDVSLRFDEVIEM